MSELVVEGAHYDRQEFIDDLVAGLTAGEMLAYEVTIFLDVDDTELWVPIDMGVRYTPGNSETSPVPAEIAADLDQESTLESIERHVGGVLDEHRRIIYRLKPVV